MKKKRWKISRVRQLSNRNLSHQSLLQDKTFLSIITGIMFGVAVSTLFLIEPKFPKIPLSLPHSWPRTDDATGKLNRPIRTQHFGDETVAAANETAVVRKQLYVGVLTAGRFLKTRATACNRTWGQGVPDLEFFSQVKTTNDWSLPIVTLQNISDDVYPPQQKAFEMLKYMCNHHIHDFNWFLRADDDVYVKVDKLLAFLSQIDHGKMVYIGQPGHGFPEVRHKLGLDGHNFCMGGPGVVFSRAALMGLCPHLDQCMAAVVSKEEDVEIGRCVTKHLGIECTRSWEFMDLFYHAYKEDFHSQRPFSTNLHENPHVIKALTLHYAKEPHIMYRLHRYYTSQKLIETRQTIQNLKETIGMMKDNLLNRVVMATDDRKRMRRPIDTMVGWSAFTLDRRYLVPNTESVTNTLQNQFHQAVKSALKYLTQDYGSDIKFGHFRRGLYRYHHGDQLDFLLDFVFEDGKEKRLTTKRIRLIQTLNRTRTTMSSKHKVETSQLYIVLPDSDGTGDLKSFMQTYAELVHENISLLKKIMLIFAADSLESVEKIKSVITTYKQKYPHLRTSVQTASSLCKIFTDIVKNVKTNEDSLVLVGNTQMKLSLSLFQNCYGNTIQGKQIYLPVPLVQNISLAEEKAAWQTSGVIFCAHSSDFKALIDLTGNVVPWNQATIAEHFEKIGLQTFKAYQTNLKIPLAKT
ncbi:chondroitin sulfate synthase 3-like [Ptychodera flava]|uniref:chondroitin sulfate synthase 3-like n=1 Tax=Ptychodera flava TaxID=63121 RepID=UPI00396A86BD